MGASASSRSLGARTSSSPRSATCSGASVVLPHGHTTIGILYEHPTWFEPLFAELDRHGLPYDRLLAYKHRFDPAERECPYSLVVNRMSPSAYTRDHAAAIFYTLEYLAHLKNTGANVVNGYDAYRYEVSKARQIGLLRRLGLAHPPTRVINHPGQAPLAAEALRFPILLKPNIGGSGAKIARFDTPQELQRAVDAGALDLGVDHTALVQECLPAAGDSIVRVEILNGEFLYAIRLAIVPGEFNLCPSEYCQPPSEPAGVPTGCLAEPANGSGGLVEPCTPPADVITQVRRIIDAACIDVGGVEYLVDPRNGEVVYYDINALSMFVADAVNVVGFDPWPALVDYLVARAGVRPAAALRS